MITRLALLATAMFVVSACGATDMDLLGGRQKCWDSSDKRLATLMKGNFDLSATPAALDTPEGESFDLRFATYRVERNASGSLTVVDSSGSEIAKNGALVTVFGGLGSDGVIVVCSLEDPRHAY